MPVLYLRYSIKLFFRQCTVFKTSSSKPRFELRHAPLFELRHAPLFELRYKFFNEIEVNFFRRGDR